MSSSNAADSAGRYSEAEEIRRLVERRLEAIRAKDVEGATSMLTTECTLFDVVDPLRSTGAGAASRRAEYIKLPGTFAMASNCFALKAVPAAMGAGWPR